MTLDQLVTAYNSSATLVGFYWHFYAVVAFALVGYAQSGSKPIPLKVRCTLLLGFWAFAFASLGALLNKHGLHYEFANEITRVVQKYNLHQDLKTKLTVCEGISKIFPTNCLHATKPLVPGMLHIGIDILVTGILLWERRK